MVKKIKKYLKFVVCCALIISLIAPSYAALSASDGSAFVTKAEFDSALADFNARLTTFEAGINSKIDSQVTSYLDRNGIWNGKIVTPEFTNFWTEWNLSAMLDTPIQTTIYYGVTDSFNDTAHKEKYNNSGFYLPTLAMGRPKTDRWIQKFKNNFTSPIKIAQMQKSGLLVCPWIFRSDAEYRGDIIDKNCWYKNLINSTGDSFGEHKSYNLINSLVGSSAWSETVCLAYTDPNTTYNLGGGCLFYVSFYSTTTASFNKNMASLLSKTQVIDLHNGPFFAMATSYASGLNLTFDYTTTSNGSFFVDKGTYLWVALETTAYGTGVTQGLTVADGNTNPTAFPNWGRFVWSPDTMSIY